MSRLAKESIQVPEGLQVVLENEEVVLKGTKSSLRVRSVPNVDIKIGKEGIQVGKSANASSKNVKSFLGLQVALIKGAIRGLSQGNSKELVMKGVGYKAATEGRKLVLQLGYSHPIKMDIPDGIEITCPKPNEVRISGCNAQRVGQIAATIRSYRPPEPYLGKGLRYKDEVILSKQGKK